MLEELKNLQIDDDIEFLNEDVIDFLEEESLTITDIQSYLSEDDNEMVIVMMGEYYLVAHNFESEEKYYVYQLICEGDTTSLEEDGFKILNDDDEFRNKIVIREERKSHIYYHTDVGAIYSLSKKTGEEVSICEYQSSSSKLDMILIEMEDDDAFVLQGFEITDKDFQLPE